MDLCEQGNGKVGVGVNIRVWTYEQTDVVSTFGCFVCSR